MPVVFISHGSPMLAVEDDDSTAALRRMGEDLPRPRAIVVVSAHWEAASPIRVGSIARPPLIYDFSGFPEELYRQEYPCPGDPVLASDIVKRFAAANVTATLDAHRGLDHGAWVPMRHLYPGADIPVLEVSLPMPRTPAELLAMGRALAPLRDDGILIVGSGGVVHNLRRVRFHDKQAPVDPWARDFDRWIRDRLGDPDVETIVDYRKRAPSADLAVPTTEHFDPIFVVLGARREGDRVSDRYEGFQYGNLSMRCFSLG